MYGQNGTYPARWHEIDMEFSPGFTALSSSADVNHPHFLATGTCYSSTEQNNLPTYSQCPIASFDSPETVGQHAGSDLSLNTYNYRAIDGYPYAHSNDQVFMPSNNKDNVFTQFYTYYIYYTPKGIYWTKDLPEQKLTLSAPETLPTPVFVKKDYNIVNSDPNWQSMTKEAMAFEYDGLPLTPKLMDGSLTETGALMDLSINLWDGSNTDPNHQQDWGGEINPSAGSSSAYKYIAFYPLQTPVSDVVNDPTKLQYGSAAIYSDFTTKDGGFYINGQKTSFANLWQVSNGQYIWPLGQLDTRNIVCGNGELQLKISTNYPATRQNYERFTQCEWLNQN